MRRFLPIANLTLALALLPGCFSSADPEGVGSPVTAEEPQIAAGDQGASDMADSRTSGEAKREQNAAGASVDKSDSDGAAPRGAEAKPAKPQSVARTKSVRSAPPAIDALSSVGGASSNRLNSSVRRGTSSGRVAGASRTRSAGKSAKKSPKRAMYSAKGASGAAYKVSASSNRAQKVLARKQARNMAIAPVAPAEPVYDDLDHGGTFAHAGTNPFTMTSKDKLSTFAIDVDTASYTYARRFLKQGNRPNASSVRVEEWINAFHYSYRAPTGKHPFGIDMEAGPSPLDEGRHILRVGIQGKKVAANKRKPVHLTFLVDTSGSMSRNDKLPLAQKALRHLVGNLSSKDSVALITYAGSTRQVLPQTSAKHKQRIYKAISNLRSGGGTAMGSGMEMAYRNAGKFVAPGSVSRVVVLSDGDANIGRTRHQDILASVKGYVSEGITLSTVGFGTGNYRDHLMEQLANAGDGNYSYIDSFAAAKKVFGTDLSGTLQVIAKDVKIQVEMNPKVVRRYRLLGYENRDVADKDFRNDKVDAGEIGAGHSVTALYEVELVNPRAEVRDDVATVRVRYKQPRGTKATEVSKTFTQNLVRTRFGDLDRDTRWAAAVSLAAEVLRGSPYARDKSLEDAWALAAEAAGGKYKRERRELVDILDVTHRREAVAVR